MEDERLARPVLEVQHLADEQRVVTAIPEPPLVGRAGPAAC